MRANCKLLRNVESWLVAMVGVFITWKLPNATDQGFYYLFKSIPLQRVHILIHSFKALLKCHSLFEALCDPVKSLSQ